MKKLQDYYKEQQKKLFKWSITAWIFLTALMTWIGSTLSTEIPNTLANWANRINFSWLSSLLNSSATQIFVQEILKWLLALATPTTIVTIFYFYSLKAVDTKWWKRKYPEYNINGEWRDLTIYTQCLNSTGWVNPMNIGESTVIFEQTCRQIRIPPSDGEGFVWQSIIVEWDNQENLHILYQVQYTNLMQQKGYPASRTGYERMHIDRSGWITEKQKPQKMRGHFWHCISSDDKPMYLGDVIYERTTN